MKFKRNAELSNKVENLLNNGSLNDESKVIVQSLYNHYKSNTFENWQDRHPFYRDMVSEMINDCSFEDDELAEKMANEHPTLQQNFMRLCRKFIVRMSKKTIYDDRNRNSVVMAKRMVDAIKEESCLPFI